MYKALFISDDGTRFLFDTSNNIVFDIAGLSGISVNHTTTQGAGQIGESIGGRSVGSKYLEITGVIFNRIIETTNAMRSALGPFRSGRLIFNDKYFINVSVADTPTFAANKKKGNFTMRLLCPFPFFKEIEQILYTVGTVEKSFRFPINYRVPHRFGTRSMNRLFNCINNGDTETDFTVEFICDGQSRNPTLTNIKTFEKIKINRTLNSGDIVKIYQDTDGVLRCVSVLGETETNIMQDLDEASNLFKMHRGDNMLLANDDDGGAGLSVQIFWNETAVGVYDEA